MYKKCVSRPRGGRNPGKHSKTTVFNPTPGPPSCQAGKPRGAASPFWEAVLAQASHRTRGVTGTFFSLEGTEKLSGHHLFEIRSVLKYNICILRFF